MSPDPCFSDTCSVDLEFDGTGPGLTADVKFNPLGALECRDPDDPDNVDGDEGLWVRVFGDPAAVKPGDCETLLGRTLDNELFARRPGFERFSINPANVAVPGSLNPGTTTTIDLGQNFRNDGDCARLLIARTTYQLNHTVDTGSDRFYYADFTFQLEFDGVNQYTFSEAVGGAAPGDGSEDFRIVNWFVTSHHLIAAGDTIDVDVLVTRINPPAASYGGTIATTGTGPGGNDNGLNVGFSGVLLDLASATDLVTVI